MTKNPTIEVHILSPNKVIWKGEASAVSAINKAGAFDVLPEHANFITICIDSPLTVHLPNNQKKDFHFDRFAMYNRNNKISIYAEV